MLRDQFSRRNPAQIKLIEVGLGLEERRLHHGRKIFLDIVAILGLVLTVKNQRDTV
jgi:hypothetical protein